MESERIDPVCLIHGKRWSEHECLYCCICFKDLTPEECHVLPNGDKEDICNDCAIVEAQLVKDFYAKLGRPFNGI